MQRELCGTQTAADFKDEEEQLQTARYRGKLCWTLAAGGHLAVLRRAREHGCPWDQWTCAYAALHGHLEVLRWALENGCPWDGYVCAYAARGDHLDVLRWAREHGYQ